jgi:hypothetical protein
MTNEKKPALVVLPGGAERERESEAKRATRRVAEALGEVVGADAHLETAFAFTVHPSHGDAGRSLIVAGAPRFDGQVVLGVARDDAFAGMRLGSTIASSPWDRLVDGARITVEVNGKASAVRLSLLGLSHVLLADVEGGAPPAPAPAPGASARIERCLARLLRLHALDAPPSAIDDEKALIRRRHAELLASGWSPESDPLPEPLRVLFTSVVPASRRRL